MSASNWNPGHDKPLIFLLSGIPPGTSSGVRDPTIIDRYCSALMSLPEAILTQHRGQPEEHRDQHKTKDHWKYEQP
jgi:hypothetical protein